MTYLKRGTLILLLIFSISPSVNSQCLKSDTLYSDINVDKPRPAKWLADQGIDTTNTTEILSLINSGSLVDGVYASQFLAERGQKQSIPHILERYKETNFQNVLTLSLIKSLQKLDYDNTTDILKEYASKSFQVLPNNNLGYKSAVRILFKNQDYNHLSNIIDMIREKATSEYGDSGYLYTLSCAFNAEQHQDLIINTLIFILENYQDSRTRLRTTMYAEEFPESDKLKKAIKKTAISDPDYLVRDQSLRILQNVYHESSTLDLALKNLRQTTIPEEVENYLNIITSSYTPRSLHLIKDLKDSSSSNVIREKSEEIYDNYWWLYFEPYGKVFNYSASQTLDSLNAYTNDIASYDWLGDQGFVRELTNRLDNASRHLAQGDSSNTAKQVDNYKERLKEVYEQNQQNNSPRFVTDDGYKFLTKNAEYLLTQLPEHPSNKNGGR